jgi:uncharacterized Fe-S radical SAM superfamily protein PflX
MMFKIWFTILKLQRYSHVTRSKSLSNTILTGTVAGKRKKGKTKNKLVRQHPKNGQKSPLQKLNNGPRQTMDTNNKAFNNMPQRPKGCETRQDKSKLKRCVDLPLSLHGK